MGVVNEPVEDCIGERRVADCGVPVLDRTVIEAACWDILADGKAINLRELNARVPKEVLGSIRGVIDVLQEVKETLGVS